MSDWLGLVVVVSIFLVMAGFSCSVDLGKFFSYIKKPRGILIGLVSQYVICPLIAYSICRILNISSLHSLGFIVLGTCPGGTLSNFWCWFFGADLELSIAMTASSSLLSFAFLSMNCIIYIPLVADSSIKVDYVSLTVSVAALICGVVCGLCVSAITSVESKRACATWCVKLRVRSVLICVGAFCMILTLALGAYENTQVSSVPVYRLPLEIYLGALFFNIGSWVITFTISYFIVQLNNNQCITVCIECANQNVGLCIAVILLTIHGDDGEIAVGVPMLYGVVTAVMILIVGTLCRICGFIQNNDDDKNQKYANSGFSKLCPGLSTEPIPEDASCHEDDEHDLDSDNLEMLIQQSDMERTPSNEDAAVKQSLKNGDTRCLRVNTDSSLHSLATRKYGTADIDAGDGALTPLKSDLPSPQLNPIRISS